MFPYSILRFLPLKLLSKITGILANVRLSEKVRRPLFSWYCNFYKVNREEAEKDIFEYETFLSLFTRNLKEGLRIPGEGLVSPVDGRILEFGTIQNDLIIQAKGLHYTLEEIFGDEEYGTSFASSFLNGSYACFYLAPGDYHHIHAPLGGIIRERIYIPGALLPVSLGAVKSIPSLYCTNERVITMLETEDGLLAVVKVGATNVGSIGLEYEKGFHEINSALKSRERIRKFDQSFVCKKGDRLGTFYLGSTVIILSQKQISFNRELHAHKKVEYGESITI